MSNPVLNKDAHVLDIGGMHQNCGIDVISEFKGGHRYRGGYKLDKTKLSNEQWLAILKHSYLDNSGRSFENYGVSINKVWVITVKRSQAKSVCDMSPRGLIEALKSEGVPIVEADIPKSPYVTWTIFPTAEVKKKIQRVSLDKYYKKSEWESSSSSSFDDDDDYY